MYSHCQSCLGRPSWLQRRHSRRVPSPALGEVVIRCQIDECLPLLVELPNSTEQGPGSQERRGTKSQLWDFLAMQPPST